MHSKELKINPFKLILGLPTLPLTILIIVITIYFTVKKLGFNSTDKEKEAFLTPIFSERLNKNLNYIFTTLDIIGWFFILKYLLF